jgi:hypothetical protein
MGASVKALQYFFIFIGKDGIIKDLKLKILICLNVPISKHWTPLHQTPHIFPIPLANWAIFAGLEVVGGGLQMFFQLKK